MTATDSDPHEAAGSAMPTPNPAVPQRPLGRSGLLVSALAFGAVKIGRNAGLKYPAGFDLPDDETLARLLDGLVDLGIQTFDTAPAYGTSEQRLGDWLRLRPGLRERLVLCTKVGEAFDPETAASTFDFSAPATEDSLARSRDRLGCDQIDVVHVHSDGNDAAILDAGDTGCVAALIRARAAGHIRAIGFSGKTVAGARAALDWADSVMVTLHADDRSHADVVAEAADRGVGVMVKKGLGSGHLEAAEALAYLAGVPGLSSVVIGSLNATHMRSNAAAFGGTPR